MTPGTNSGSRGREGGDAGGECSSVEEGGLFVGGVCIGWSLSESVMLESSKPEGLCTDVHYYMMELRVCGVVVWEIVNAPQVADLLKILC
jgi:hypothetical protein